MRAIYYERYGGPDDLELRDVPRPVPRDDEVLVRVRASSINSFDWDLLRGRWPRLPPRAIRTPVIRILGADVAGTIEEVGSAASGFDVGDDVYGDLSGCGFGGFAEYVAVPARVLARKPAAVTFAHAAATPQAAGLALQALRKRTIRKGDRILLNGAGGGVGTFALQLLKPEEAHVTAVDHGAKLDALRALGADEVVDYTRDDFTRYGPFDLIVDVAAVRPIGEYRRALRPGGKWVMIGGSIPKLFAAASVGRLRMRGGRRPVLLVYRPTPSDLVELDPRFDRGEVTPVIDSEFPLEEVPKAMRRFGEGQFIGKIVITIGPS